MWPSSGPETFAVVQPPFGAKVYFAYCLRKDADSKPLADAFNAALVKMHNDGRLADIAEEMVRRRDGRADDACPTPNY